MRVQLFFVLALSCLPRTASAYCLSTTKADFVPSEEKPCDAEGLPLFWNTRCVDMYVHRTASSQVGLTTAREVLAASLSVWEAVRCPPAGAACPSTRETTPSIVAREAGPTACEAGYEREGLNTNVLTFRDRDWGHDPSMIALTTLSYRVADGEILDGDIEINSDPETLKLSVGAARPDAYDLHSVITHEAGHFLGLAHTQSANGQATMRPRYDPGDTSMRDLAADDVCGLCAAAPPTRTVACTPPEARVCNGAATPAPPEEPVPPADEPGCAYGDHACSAARGAAGGTSAVLMLAALLGRMARRHARRRSRP
ncbi:MAG: matrixin family metalloprotease [Deltaproteobacteria bacterium]|nr:matrixin family metalloprotease [Deltaproteobacteria bacterium]